MNWKVEHFQAPEFVKVTTEGKFTVPEHYEMIRDIVSRVFWKPGMNAFFDHRKLEFPQTDIEVMKLIAENHKRFEKEIGDGKAAILMKSLADFARGRQFELLTKTKKRSAKVEIFLKEDKALEWLNSA